MTRKKISSLYILYILIGLIVSFLIGISINHQKETVEVEKIAFKINDCDHVRWANAPISPSKKLNDLNEAHLLHAEKNGLKHPFVSNEDFESKIEDYKRRFILTEVTDNKFYQLKSLTHSYPYLIPEAVDMLNEIGYRFQERLTEKKYKKYRFRITSLLRSEETQNKLSHRNSNATAHSAHLYGTTVDISYKNFLNAKNDSVESSWEGIQALTKVLVDMREECRLLVVRERKQACFHITVVVCKPDNEENNENLTKAIVEK
ncbi:MAG: DUF5715 family protein [Paludibacter sp.]|nr:DUF5715 family protein [Paludibacter sp.]